MVTRMPGIDARTPLAPVGPDRLSGTRFTVRRVRETGSTNADLLAAAADGAPDGTVLMAEHQTAGRGRRGRTWQAPPGASLLVSVLLRPAIEPDRSAVLTAAVGLAARAACASGAGVTPSLKWPNDLVAATPAGERKLGGILAESRLASGQLDAVVVGLGLNVAWPEPPPDDLVDIAVALDGLTEGPHAPDRVDLLVALLRDLEDRLAAVEAGDDAAVWADWKRASATLGRTVRIETGAEDLTGQAIDISDRGRLLVDLPDGSRREIDVGDVVHLRPAP